MLITGDTVKIEDNYVTVGFVALDNTAGCFKPILLRKRTVNIGELWTYIETLKYYDFSSKDFIAPVYSVNILLSENSEFEWLIEDARLEKLI